MDDIVEVNGRIYLVEEIRFRTTTVLGRDENYVILPNSELTRNKVVNWTFNKKASRFQIDIGVAYSTNVTELMELLKEVAKSTPRVLEMPEPLFVLPIMANRRFALEYISIRTIYLEQNI